MTGCRLAGGNVAEDAPLAPAYILGNGAAGPKVTSRQTGAVNWRTMRSCVREPRLGRRREQRLGLGMIRHPEDLGLWADLEDAPRIRHCHAVRDVTHDGEIMRDEEVGQPPLLLQTLLENDRLDRPVVDRLQKPIHLANAFQQRNARTRSTARRARAPGHQQRHRGTVTPPCASRWPRRSSSSTARCTWSPRHP